MIFAFRLVARRMLVDANARALPVFRRRAKTYAQSYGETLERVNEKK
jgi:hypothetical protein